MEMKGQVTAERVDADGEDLLKCEPMNTADELSCQSRQSTLAVTTTAVARRIELNLAQR